MNVSAQICGHLFTNAPRTHPFKKYRNGGEKSYTKNCDRKPLILLTFSCTTCTTGKVVHRQKRRRSERNDTNRNAVTGTYRPVLDANGITNGSECAATDRAIRGVMCPSGAIYTNLVRWWTSVPIRTIRPDNMKPHPL